MRSRHFIVLAPLLAVCMALHPCLAEECSPADSLRLNYEQAAALCESDDFAAARKALTAVMQDAYRMLHEGSAPEETCQDVRLSSIRQFVLMTRRQEDFELSEKWIKVGITFCSNYEKNIPTAKLWSCTFLEERKANQAILAERRTAQELRDSFRKTMLAVLLATTVILSILLAAIIVLYLRMKKAYAHMAKDSRRWAFEAFATGPQPLSDSSAENSLKSRLIHFIKDEKSYLKPDLCTDDVCRSLGTNRTYVSNVFSGMSTSFSSYVNGLRIAEAIKVMTEDPQKSIEDVWTECGFKSQSTFYTWFKDLTGLTPSQFKNSNN